MSLNLMLQLWLLLSLVFVSLIPICHCQLGSPQNIETFYPVEAPEAAPEPPIEPPQASPEPQRSPPAAASRSSTSNSKIARAVGITAASTLVVSALLFFLIHRCLRARRKQEVANSGPAGDRRVVPQVSDQFERIEGNVRGMIVDENGLDVIYWRKLEGKNSRKGLQKEVLNRAKRKEQEMEDEDGDGDDIEEGNHRRKSEPIQEIPLLRGKSSTSHISILPEENESNRFTRRTPPPPPPPTAPASAMAAHKGVEYPDSPAQPSTPPPPPSPSTSFASSSAIPKQKSPAPPPPPPPPPISVRTIPATKSPTPAAPPPPPPPPPISVRTIPATKSPTPAAPPPPPPPISVRTIPATKSPTPAAPPPPPPPISVRTIPATKSPTAAAPPPPPPPISVRKSPAPPPPAPPMGGSLKSSSKPPPNPFEMPEQKKPSGEGVSGSGNDQVKLKPLHWDKVNTNHDHSMVWDKIDRGSFRFNQDLMEALFGTVATNRRSPKGKSNTTSSSRDVSAPSGKTFLLEPRKSQNIAIVLKSLAVSREEILDALIEGQGLYADDLEKLSRVVPTEEEQSQILAYKGEPSSLAVAEAFLYDILKAVPSAFKRLNTMLFRLNYDSEILNIKESLETLELGCKELRNKGLFVKLLEAVLKAGNRMNAGTSRGNAQAFNLTSLRKLSDVKSTDGKTTLLHFVVEEVVRFEGKRCVLNRNRSLNRSSSSRSSNGSRNVENSATSEQREREYITLGLPIVGGLSSEFSKVKKASLIDYNSFVGSISALSTRIVEIRQIVSQCRNDRGGKFVKEMEYFLENAEVELKLLRDEQTRVLQLVKRTTEYYQGGASKEMAENPIQLFVLVKDFLGMVDQACIEVARNLQKRRPTKPSSA